MYKVLFFAFLLINTCLACNVESEAKYDLSKISANLMEIMKVTQPIFQEMFD